jgi:hypothetical protein
MASHTRSRDSTRARLAQIGSGAGSAATRLWARIPFDPVPLVITIVAGLLIASGIGVVTEWHVMTDELLYPKIALGILDGHFFPGHVRGADSGVSNVLFSYLIAPFYGTMSMPEAWRASLTLNAWLMASTAIPAFLLTRAVVGRRLPAYLVAVMTVSIPWMMQAANLLTEATAYAAFVWAMWAMHRALVRRSTGADALAVLLVVVAYLARTQFVVLVPLLPLAAFVHELMASLAERRPDRSMLASIPDALRSVWRSHRLLWVLVGLGAIYAVARGGALLGSYSVTGQGDLFPPGFLGTMWVSTASIAIGLGALPLAFAIAFATAQLVRPRERPEHAFAVLSLLVVPILVVVVASFSLRFSAGLQERYLFYIAPLLLVGFAAFFIRRRSLLWALVGAAAAGFILTRAAYEPPVDLVGFASPHAAFYPVLQGRSAQILGWIGLQPNIQAVLWVGVFAGVALLTLALRWKGPRVFGLIGTLAAVFLVLQLLYLMPRVMADLDVSTLGIYGPRTDAQRNWVDRATETDDVVGVLGGPINSRSGAAFLNAFVDTAAVWDVEFWNRRIATVWNSGTLPPVHPATPDFAAGDLALGGPVRPTHIVMATSNPTFAPQGTAVADNGTLTLYRLTGRPSAAWVSQGIGTDGLTDPETRALIRVFGRRQETARVWTLRVLATTADLLAVPDPSGDDDATAKARRVDVRFGQSQSSGRISETGELKASACVPADGATTARLSPRGSSALEDGRRYGIRVLQVTARPTARTC